MILKKYLFIILLVFGVFAVSFNFCNKFDVSTNSSIIVEQQKQSNIISIKKDLSFDVEKVNILNKKKPESKWLHENDFIFKNTNGFKNIKICIYRTNIANTHGGGFHAFLNDGTDMYFVCDLSPLSLDCIKVQEKDVTYDNQSEFIIQATGRGGGTIVIGYDKIKKKWQILLSTGEIDFIDFDGKGKEQLVTTNYCIPVGVVDIHFWKKNHFETLRCEKALGLRQIILRKIDKEIYMVGTGFVSAHNQEKSKYFQYKNGALIEVKNPFDN